MTAIGARRTFAASAFAYAARGWHVFPVRPAAKAPLTRKGLHDATTDRAQIDEWARRWQDANTGVRTGAESGLVVLDVDGDDGMESLRRWERANDPLPTTLSVVTPRGGAHYYFAHPGGVVPCSAGKLGAGLDVRADGGYVVAPPSLGANGRTYEIDEDAPLAPLPGWLAEAIGFYAHGAGREATPAEEWIRLLSTGLGRGSRNDGLARLIGHLLAKDVDARVVLAMIHLVNAGACRPPLARREVDRIFESIASRELRKRAGERR